jgi:LmbE family N-acetylglucosaminyl deacetylase
MVLAVSTATVNAPGVIGVVYDLAQAPAVAALPEAEGYSSADRVLVLSPHPDDDVLCCSASVRRALEAGAGVWILYFTSGDGFEFDALVTERSLRPGAAGMLSLGRRRMAEAVAGAAALGVDASRLRFLGYPDGGLRALELQNARTPYRSRYTGRTAVPYGGTVRPGAPYTGEALERDLSTVLDEVRPTRLLAPSPLDAHPDHRAVGEFALRALGARGLLGATRYWIVHGGLEWPLPKGDHPGLPLTPPPRGRGLPWRRVPLEPFDQALKRDAIRAHRSQVAVLGRFMIAFDRTNELLSPVPTRP